MRLFAALTPPPEVRARLASAVDALRAQGTGRFTAPENLHMTLVFLGETERAEDAAAALSSLTAAPFSVRAAAVGSFGDLYWLGMQPSDELAALQKEVEIRLRGAGFAPERREFIPHITLARRFVPAAIFDPTRAEKAAGSLLWPVNAVTLMESRQENGGTVYVPRYEKELSAK